MRRQAGQPLGHARKVDLRAEATRQREFRGGSAQPARAEVLAADRYAFAEDPLQSVAAGVGEDALEERIVDLHRAAIAARLSLIQDLGGEGSAPQPRIVGRLAGQDDDIRHAVGLGRNAAAHNAAPGHDPHGHHVHQAVVVEAGMEDDVAAKVGHAERVAILRDSLDDPASDRADPRRVGPVGIAEAQAVEHADHVPAHAVHVADDAPDPRRRSLHGQNLRRMVVALVGHDEAPLLSTPVAQADQTGILAGAEHDLGRQRRKVLLQERPAALVGAVLAPADVEEERLRQGWIAT